MKQNEILHVNLVLDASGSMSRLSSKVVEVADAQIAAMKTRSEELDLEVRVSVYTFSYAHRIECLIFDKDVFRLPSIKGLYHANGQTALVDATIKSQQDLAQTCQIYGKHNFLTFVVTDGMENDSRNSSRDLASLLNSQGANWSVAALVPNEQAKSYALSAGFPAGNILIWDATSAAGLQKASDQIKEATNTYMTSVSRGAPVDKNNIFGTGLDKVNEQTVQTLTPITPGSFVLWDVTADERIDDFVRRNNKGIFNVGRGYYELKTRVMIQANKDVIILNRKTGQAYGGFDAVRQLLGLPKGADVRVTPDTNPDFQIFVKSTANNRKLLGGTQLLYLR